MKKLGFGFMRLPQRDEDDPKSVEMDKLCEMVNHYFAQGFTYIDTAFMYHAEESEGFVRQSVVERYPRESFVLADKLPMALMKEAHEMEEKFALQLQRCGVEYFDNYLLHNLNAETYQRALDFDAFGFVREKQAKGQIRRLGFSFHDSAELLDRILTDHPEMEFVQLQINYLDWENDSIQSRLNYETARRHGKSVIVMEPVKGGALAIIPQEAEALLKEKNPHMSAASWAVRFAAGLEGVEVVLSGMSDMAQLMDNTSYMADFSPLTREEEAVMWQARDIINASIAIPCTACQYCVDTCPQNIPIPKYFALYNNEKQTIPRAFSLQKMYYGNMTRTFGKASDCIDCKQCEHHCPQMLDVTGYLAQVAQQFED